MVNPEVISIRNLAHYAKIIWNKQEDYNWDTMFIPGRIEELHRNLDQKIGLRPNRKPFNTIFIFDSGECKYHIGLNSYVLKPKSIIVIPENVISYTSHYKNVRGICLVFKTEYLFPLLKNNVLTESFPFYESDAYHVASLTDSRAGIMRPFFTEILNTFHSSSADKHNLIKCYLEILLLKAKECFQSPSLCIPQNNSRASVLTRNFKSLVLKNYLSGKSISEYSSMLNVSSKHLNDMVKQTLGKTPNELIHEMLLLEAKVLLRQTDLNISEVAFKLNFGDQSYFSRFFRKHTDHSPLEYRELV